MQKYGFIYCLQHTAKLKVCYRILRFNRINAKFKSNSLSLEVADTINKRQLGLSFRDGLRNGEGMLFVYPRTEKHIVWMMNMHFSIDILWLDDYGKVLYKIHGAPRSSSLTNFAIYSPDKKSKYVLELAAGSAKRYGITLGSRIKLSKV